MIHRGKSWNSKTIGKVWFVCKVVVLEPVVLLPVKKLQYYLHFKKVCDPRNFHLNLQLNIRMNPLYLNQKSAQCWIFVVPYNGIWGFHLHLSHLVFIYQFITKMTVLVELTFLTTAEQVIFIASHNCFKIFWYAVLLKMRGIFCFYLLR